MNRVSLCMAFYENPGVLARQYEEWVCYPDHIKENLEVLIVDDGSPTGPAIDVARPAGLPPLKIFRMLEDLRWNQDACRNLAAEHASHPWLLLTDMDHIVPWQTMERVITGKLQSNRVYRFHRVSAPNLQPYKQHPNSWLVAKKVFDQVGGYDETYCGLYGTDFDIRNRLWKAATPDTIKEVLIRVPREVIPDASTTTLTRKTPEDSAEIQRLRDQIEADPDHRPARRNAPWERLL